MRLQISVKDAVQKLEAARQQLGDKKFNLAVSRSLNEAMLQGRTEARKAVKDIYNIPQRYFSKVDQLNKASSNSLVSLLLVSAKPLPMDAFSPKFQTSTTSLSISRKGEQKSRTLKSPRANIAQGVSIEVIRGRREVVPYAFLIAGGKPRVFARGQYKSGSGYGFIQRHKRVNKDGNDIPVKPLLSVTVHAAVLNKASLKRVDARLNAVFPTILERNVSFLLSRVGT